MSDPYDTQVGGDHYKKMKIQPSEFINKNEMQFAEGNAIKYICRHGSKGKLQDLQKAKHYIDMIIERDYADEAKNSSVDSGLDINIEDVNISYSNEELNGAIYYPSGASVGQEGFDE
jgi:hypothetical protein